MLDLSDKIKTTEDIAKFRTRYPHLSLKRLESVEKPIDIVDWLVKDMDRYGVQRAVIQPIPNVGAKEVALAVAKHPKRLLGLCPLGETFELPPKKYRLEGELQTRISDGITKYGLKGIAEVHLGSFADEPEKISANMVPLLDILAKHKFPLLIHTGWSQHAGEIELRASNPIYLDNVAARYPEVPMILAHMGRGMNYFFEPALAVALRNSNVYLDTADSSTEHIRIAAEKLGPDRIMFGTDWSPTQRFIKQPADVFGSNLNRVYEAIHNETDLDWILGKTALQLYGI